MRTPEQIADAIIFVNGPENKKVTIDVVEAMLGEGQALRRLIVDAAREAQADAESLIAENTAALQNYARSVLVRSFKPEGEPDEFRDTWKDISASEYRAGDWPVPLGDYLPSGWTVTIDQARRILQMLSSEAS